MSEKTNNRNNGGGRSNSPSSSPSPSNPSNVSSELMKKSPLAMERLMSKSKKTKRKQKQMYVNIMICIAALFLAPGMISLVSTSRSVQQLTDFVYQSSTRTVESTRGSSFTVPQSNNPNLGRASSIHEAETPSTNHGHIFAQARSMEGSDQPETLHLNSNFITTATTRSTVPKSAQGYDQEMLKYSYNYYYYDSSSQAFHLQDQYTTFPDKPASVSSNFQKSLALSGRYQPSLCTDGQTYGFSDLGILRNAIHELGNAYSQAVTRFQHYNSARSEYELIKFIHQQSGEVPIESPPPLPEHLTAVLEKEPDPFVICPHTTLKAPLSRHMTININAEDVIVECNSCVIDAPGTHFSFGPHAKNVLVRGITLMGATQSSIVFRYDGADVSFEDCYWVNNDSVGMHGAVADMNSTSTVKFYRCEISDMKQSSPRAGMHGVPNTVASSLTLRSN